jgi:hypothetical protein
MRRLLIALALTTTVVTGVTAAAGPASAAVRGLDLQRDGCDLQAPGTVIKLRAFNVNGLRCYNGIYDLWININTACRQRYGNTSSAYYLNYNDPYSWRCT